MLCGKLENPNLVLKSDDWSRLVMCSMDALCPFELSVVTNAPAEQLTGPTVGSDHFMINHFCLRIMCPQIASV